MQSNYATMTIRLYTYLIGIQKTGGIPIYNQFDPSHPPHLRADVVQKHWAWEMGPKVVQDRGDREHRENEKEYRDFAGFLF